jgi:hypothetical protein
MPVAEYRSYHDEVNVQSNGGWKKWKNRRGNNSNQQQSTAINSSSSSSSNGKPNLLPLFESAAAGLEVEKNHTRIALNQPATIVDLRDGQMPECAM